MHVLPELEEIERSLLESCSHCKGSGEVHFDSNGRPRWYRYHEEEKRFCEACCGTGKLHWQDTNAFEATWVETYKKACELSLAGKKPPYDL